MANEYDEFSALDQLTSGATITGASPLIRIPTRKLSLPAPKAPSSPSATPGVISPTILMHNDPSMQSSTQASPPIASVAKTALVPKRMAIPSRSFQLPPSHPTVAMAVSNVAASLSAIHNVSPLNPAIQDAATAIVQDAVSSAASAAPGDANAPASTLLALASPSSSAADSAVASSAIPASTISAAASAMASSDTSTQTPQSSGNRQGKRTMATLQDGPNRQFVQPLGFFLAAIAAATAQDVTSRPQGVAYKPTRIIVPSALAANFTLVNVRVGTDSQFVGTVDVAAQTFTEVAVGVALEMGTAASGMDITVTAKNTDTAAAHDFRCAMIGVVFKPS